ncbi:MAG TPA: hypothetical protein VMU34_08245 [Mycobacterium sp.]|nr:hypothetical protein [Mycobacterium sp.]
MLLAAIQSHRAGLRIGVAAQTRAQAADSARRLAAICDRARIGVLWKTSGVRPDAADCPIIGNRYQIWPAEPGAVRVATTAKWLSAEPDRLKADLLIVDEATSCTGEPDQATSLVPRTSLVGRC